MTRQFDVSIAALRVAIEMLREKGALTLDDLHALLSDPSWKETLGEVAKTLKNTDATVVQFLASSQNITELTKNLAEASKRWPELADTINQIGKTSARYQKPILIATLLGLVARAITTFFGVP